MRASLYLGPFFPGTARFVNAQTILRTRELEIIIHLSAALAKSGPLDLLSEKSFLLFYAHEKGLGQNGLVVLQFSFFCVATSQK